MNIVTLNKVSHYQKKKKKKRKKKERPFSECLL